MQNDSLHRSIFRAWRYWRSGVPLPVDVHGSLLRLGIIPDRLIIAFDSGRRPFDIIHEYINRIPAFTVHP